MAESRSLGVAGVGPLCCCLDVAVVVLQQRKSEHGPFEECAAGWDSSNYGSRLQQRCAPLLRLDSFPFADFECSATDLDYLEV